MTTDLDIAEEPTGLTSQQEKAAALDAAGESRPTIARICEVTPKTISSWRKSPAYRLEVGRIRGEVTDALDARAATVKLKLLDGIDEAITTLREALTAEREDGTPEYGTRARAAEALLGKAKFVYDDPGGTGGGVAAAASIVVNLSPTGEIEVLDGPATIEGKTV